MNYKNYTLFLFLLTPQVEVAQPYFSALGIFERQNPSVERESAPVKVSQSAPVLTTDSNSNVPSPSRVTRVRGWFSSKYDAAKGSVTGWARSTWARVKETTSNTKKSADSALKRVTDTLTTYPKLSAAASGLLSYLLLKPCAEQYIQWKSENKKVVTGSVCALVGAGLLGLKYLGKLPRIQLGVAASFVGGLFGAGLADHVYAEYQQEDNNIL